MLTSARAEPGRGAGQEPSLPLLLQRHGPHGSVARLCVRGLPGAGRGLRLPAGAGAAQLGVALALELVAARALALAPGISFPRGPVGGRLGRSHRAASPALAPRGCRVSARRAWVSGPL